MTYCSGDFFDTLTAAAKGLPLGLFLGVGELRGGSTKKIIYTDIVEIRQNMKRGYGNVEPAQFVIRIGGLMDIQ